MHAPNPAFLHRPLVRVWLTAVAALMVLTLVVGGATRLTESGLSIVEWKPVALAITGRPSAMLSSATAGQGSDGDLPAPRRGPRLAIRGPIPYRFRTYGYLRGPSCAAPPPPSGRRRRGVEGAPTRGT